MNRTFGVGWMATGACLVVAAGCSGRSGDRWRTMMPPTYPGSGSVTYKGKPLADATVLFHPAGGISTARRAAAGVTDSAGRFTLTTLKPGDGAVAGPFFVTVHKTVRVMPDAAKLLPNEFGERIDMAIEKPLIPERYFSTETSGFSAEIKPSGRNEFSFSLD